MSCGDCTECCYVFPIPELNKPRHRLCQYCKGGCSIHGGHPDICKDYQCEFIRQGWDEELRPDKCGVLVDKREGEYFAMLVRNVPEKKMEKVMNKIFSLGRVEMINALKGYEKS